jgi:hypothetical protein
LPQLRCEGTGCAGRKFNRVFGAGFLSMQVEGKADQAIDQF